MRKEVLGVNPYSSVQELRPIWKVAMHLADISTHANISHTDDCSQCKILEKKAVILKKLALTADSAAQDLKSLATFCLGVFATAKDAVDEGELQQGLKLLDESTQLGNMHAVHYLASIYAGSHRIISSIKDEQKAIEYFLTAFRLGNYEGLNDLMFNLRTGLSSIAKNVITWQQLLVRLFLEAGKNGDNRSISSLIRCLIQQDYSKFGNENFLFRACEILNFWMKKPCWKEQHTLLVKEYIQQGMAHGNKDVIYINDAISAHALEEKKFSGSFFSNRLGNTNENVQQDGFIELILLSNALHNEIDSINNLILMANSNKLDVACFMATSLGKLRKFSCLIDTHFTPLYPGLDTNELMALTEGIDDEAQGTSYPAAVEQNFAQLQQKVNEVATTVASQNPSPGQLLQKYTNSLSELINELKGQVASSLGERSSIPNM